MGRKQKQLSEETLILAYRIREARLKKYKTVKEAAELFPVEKTLWGFWETARVTPQERTMEKLSAFLGVSIDLLHQKPENWNVERKRFLAELIRRIKGFKDYYKITLPDADDGEPPQKDTPDASTPLAVFLQITRLIADAQASVHAGKISQEAYDTHMQMIADMVVHDAEVRFSTPDATAAGVRIFKFSAVFSSKRAIVTRFTAIHQFEFLQL